MQKENVESIEHGILITYKDKSCTFIMKAKMKKDGGRYIHTKVS